MSKKLVWLLASVLAAGMIAAGCGGGNDNSRSSLTKAEFIAKADAICKTHDAAIAAEAKQVFTSGKVSPAAQNQFALGTAIPNTQKEIDEIDALGAPSGDEDQVKAILDSVQKGIDAVKADPSKITGNGPDSPFAEANKLTKDYGFKVCGQNGG